MKSAWTRWMGGTIVAVAVLVAGQASTARADSGTWSETTGDGQWSDSGNWTSNTIADGAGFTADFSQINLDAQAVYDVYGDDVNGNPLARNAVYLNSARTIGHVVFGDSNTASPGGWEVYAIGDAEYLTNILTLSATSPTITVNTLSAINTSALVGALPQTPELIDDALVRNSVASANGFTKMGSGILTLAGANPNLHGTVTVAQGTLRARSTATFDYETATDPERTQFHVLGGATLETAASIGQNAAGGPGISIEAGATATIRKTGTGSLFFANIGGAGSTLNFESTGGTVSLDRDWNVGGALANLNLIGVGAPRDYRIRNNGGTFGAATLANTAVNLTNAVVFTNTNSGGNTNTFGSLSGDATSILRGGAAGTVVTYVVGGLGTSTTFAGEIQTGNGINLFKVGGGTMELSGNLTYQPTTNANLAVRGGVTRVEGGTLKLSGAAAIPGGLDALTPSTVDIRSGANLDVSSIASYSTAPFQQIIGAGTIKGNFTHDEGLLAPGDTNVGGNTQTLTSVAGTLTFDNNLSFAGSGEISFTMATTPAGANDKIQVNGSASLTGTPVITPTFPGGVPAAGQTYTLLTANGGFGGTNPSGWSVLWPGRGAGPVPFVSGNDVRITSAAIVAHNLNWSGLTDANWNTTTTNFYNNTTSSNDHYTEFDNVTFSDTYNTGSPTPVANTNVTLPGVVNPGVVTINSNSTNYTFAGAGRIGGSGSLVKQGTSTVTISNANTYTGGTTISNGIVNLGTAGVLGTGTVTLAGGKLYREAGTVSNAIVVQASTTSTISNNHNTNGLLLLNGAISGSGNLVLENNSPGVPDGDPPTAPVVNGIDFGGDNAGFTGTITIGGPTPVFYRSRLATSMGTNAAWNLGNNGSTVGAVVGANSVFNVGSLSGGPSATVSGHESGGGVGSSTYRIGALNTSTEFSGIVKDGRMDTNTGNFTAITKVGTGTLTLSGANTYTGDTRVEGGTLRITSDFLANAADVFISSGAIFNLDFIGDDVIDALYLNGVPQSPGFYGAAALGAAFFAGTGRLEVSTLGPVLGLAGDYNGDNTVDAADYTVWRNNLGGDGSAFAAGSRDPMNGGVIDGDDYTFWKANYGNSLPGSGSGGLAAVPEPASAALLLLAVGMFAVRRSRGRSC